MEGPPRTRGEHNIDWIEKYCRVPEGILVGQPLILQGFQRQAIIEIYDNPLAPTRTAIISMGRKNAKTTISATLLLLHLCGYESAQNSELYSTAQSRDQASILFKLSCKIVRQSPELESAIKITDSRKILSCPERGTVYRALSSDVATSYGLSSKFVVHDELGQVVGPESELYTSVESSSGAHENPLSVIISTQARTDQDLLSMLIDDCKINKPANTVLVLHESPSDKELEAMDTDIFDIEKAVKPANPAYGLFLSETQIADWVDRAKRMKTVENQYRNLILNQRIDPLSAFISRPVWDKAKRDYGKEILHRGEVWGGLDLSSVVDLTARVYVVYLDGKWHIDAKFWLPEVGIRDKSKMEKIPYDQWAGMGHIELCPGKVISYERIAKEIKEDFETYNIRKIAFDRWNWTQFRPWLERAEFQEWELEENSEHRLWEGFGQGYMSMSPAIRTLEELITDDKLLHNSNPVLTMCMANAKVMQDPAGNRKLDKSKSSGRIDGAIALVMAIKTAVEEYEPGNTGSDWDSDFLVSNLV